LMLQKTLGSALAFSSFSVPYEETSGFN